MRVGCNVRAHAHRLFCSACRARAATVEEVVKAMIWALLPQPPPPPPGAHSNNDVISQTMTP